MRKKTVNKESYLTKMINYTKCIDFIGEKPEFFISGSKRSKTFFNSVDLNTEVLKDAIEELYPIIYDHTFLEEYSIYFLLISKYFELFLILIFTKCPVINI